MTTALQLISGALEIVSSVSPGEAIDSGEAGSVLATLNRMLKAWSAEDLMPPFRTIESFSITSGVGSRTIGSGAQVNTVRPDDITGAYWREGDQDYPVYVRMTKEEYNAISQKSSTGRPEALYYDTQFPIGVIYFDRTTDATRTLFLESLKPFNSFTTLQTSMDLPGEYEETIIYQLVRRIAPGYGFVVQPGSDLDKLIVESEERIKRKNFRMAPAVLDPALRTPPPFDIEAG